MYRKTTFFKVCISTIWITIFSSCFENGGVNNPSETNCRPISIKVYAVEPKGLDAWRLKGQVKSLALKTIINNDTTNDSVVFDKHGEVLCRYNEFWTFALQITNLYDKNGRLYSSIQSRVYASGTITDTIDYSYDSFGNTTMITYSSGVRYYTYCASSMGAYRLCTLADNSLEDSSTFDLQGNILTMFTYKPNGKCAGLKKYQNNLPIENNIADSNCEYHKTYVWDYAEHGNTVREHWIDENTETFFSYLHFDSNNNWTERIMTNNRDSTYICKQIQSITYFN